MINLHGGNKYLKIKPLASTLLTFQAINISKKRLHPKLYLNQTISITKFNIKCCHYTTANLQKMSQSINNSNLQISLVEIEKPSDDTNFILGHSHFIKTVEDLYEAIVNTNSNIKFGIAFNEASGKCLIRHTGNADHLIQIAIKNAEKINCGHTFIIFIENGFPLNILNAIKNVNEVCRVHCATANSCQVLVGESEQGRGVMGVIDGFKSKGVENEEDQKERRDFLRMIKYKQ